MLTQQQLDVRKRGIGGSEISSVLGLNPWRGPIDVWLDKTGRAGPKSDTHHTKRGQFLEPALIAWYAHETDSIVEPAGTLRHIDYPIVIATPDGIVKRPSAPNRVLEIKSPGWRTADHWGSPGTDEIPEYYIPQIQWECAVTGLETADVVAFLDGELKIYHVDFDPALFALMREEAEEWWTRYVIADVQPPLDGSDAAKEWLRKKYERVPGKVITITDHDHAMCKLAKQLAAVDAELKGLEDLKSKLRQNIGDLLGDAEKVVLPFGTISHTEASRKSTDWKLLAHELGASAELIDKYTTAARYTTMRTNLRLS